MSEILFKKVSSHELTILQEISELSFRQAFEDDNDPQDFEEYINKAFTPEQLLSEVNNPLSLFYLMNVPSEDKPIGYYKLNWGEAQSESLSSTHIELERIYLLNQFRGKGYGNKLLDHALKVSRNKEKEIIWLGVWEKNQSAIRFYKKNGFQVFDEHYFYIGNDRQRDLLLGLNL